MLVNYKCPQESFWFSFSQNDIECWEPGRVMYVTLTEGACLLLKLTFQLVVSTFFTCSTHSVEIHENGIQQDVTHRSESIIGNLIDKSILLDFNR